MFYAWRLVKPILIFHTNKFCVDIEKTSVKVVFSNAFQNKFFIWDYSWDKKCALTENSFNTSLLNIHTELVSVEDKFSLY